MKVKINPTKPVYFNKNNNLIRVGNFPKTGKELTFEDDSMVNMFNDLKDFVSIDDLYKKYKEIFKISKAEFSSNIHYLINQDILIDDKKYKELIRNKKYDRQSLYFYMVSDRYIDSGDFKSKTIGILGLGGIGSVVVELLVRAGYTNFIVLDNDKVEESNLIRQISYNKSDLGKYKTNCVEKNMKKINKGVKFTKYNIFINDVSDIPLEFKNADIILSTIDKPYRKIRRIINMYCVNNNIPVIFAGFAEHVGMIGPFVVPHNTACLNCIDRKIDDIPMNNVSIVPSYGPLCTMIGSLVTNEIINYFTDYNKISLIGKTMMFDMTNYKVKVIRWNKKIDCEVCGDINDSK